MTCNTTELLRLLKEPELVTQISWVIESTTRKMPDGREFVLDEVGQFIYRYGMGIWHETRTGREYKVESKPKEGLSGVEVDRWMADFVPSDIMNGRVYNVSLSSSKVKP